MAPKRILSLILSFALLFTCIFLLSACDENIFGSPFLSWNHEETVELNDENFFEYFEITPHLSAKTKGKTQWKASRVLGVRTCSNPVFKWIISPIDETQAFANTTVTIRVGYIYVPMQTAYTKIISRSDAIFTEYTVELDKNGCGSVVVRKTDIAVCGFYGTPTVSGVSGTCFITCTHEWDDGKTTTASTCTQAGIKTFTCLKCSYLKEEKIEALTHDLPDIPSSSIPATCTDAGNTIYICNRCNSEVSQSVEALGHDWDESNVCTRCKTQNTVN